MILDRDRAIMVASRKTLNSAPKRMFWLLGYTIIQAKMAQEEESLDPDLAVRKGPGPNAERIKERTQLCWPQSEGKTKDTHLLAILGVGVHIPCSDLTRRNAYNHFLSSLWREFEKKRSCRSCWWVPGTKWHLRHALVHSIEECADRWTIFNFKKHPYFISTMQKEGLYLLLYLS